MKSKNFAQQHLSSFGGIKVIAMLLLFWWHSSIPIPNVDLGARTCELLFVYGRWRYIGTAAGIELLR